MESSAFISVRSWSCVEIVRTTVVLEGKNFTKEQWLLEGLCQKPWTEECFTVVTIREAKRGLQLALWRDIPCGAFQSKKKKKKNSTYKI